MCLNEWVFVCLLLMSVDRLTSFESRSRSPSESRAERGEAYLELFGFHKAYVDVEFTFYYSYPSKMICFNLHFFCCVEKETRFEVEVESPQTPHSHFSVLF